MLLASSTGMVPQQLSTVWKNTTTQRPSCVLRVLCIHTLYALYSAYIAAVSVITLADQSISLE